MHADLSKPETTEQNPEALLRLLDLEMRQKRVLRQKTAERRRTSRMVGLLSIFLVIFAAVVALFFLFSQATEQKNNSQNSTNPISAGH